ncbi:TlpA family protein disulfide reductase [Sabulibacter ruber]|uniref:TlpA family protein disulfide reductase n=1 Tax=Sabulibacter ruber TaxID=2811901 RepID=UPI001A959339|nr:TlpA family protein disulfide reductase [Sabulibacter ruber]
MNHTKWLTGFLLPSCFRLPALLVLLCTGTLSSSALAQKAAYPAEGLSIGQPLPPIPLSNLLGHPSPTVRLSDFPGKLLLLDFWATWCGNCKAAMPKLDAIQREFGEKVQVLLVNSKSTGDTPEKIRAYFEKWRNPDGSRFLLPTVVQDTLLDRLFPHKLIPHLVWVSPQGTVQAITAPDQVTPENIRKALQGETATLTRKKDVDLSRPLFTEPELPTTHLKHYSILFQGQLEGVPSGTRPRRAADGTVQGMALTNTPLVTMYELAQRALLPHLSEKGLLFEIRDSSGLFQGKSSLSAEDWFRQHAWSYDLVGPAGPPDQLFGQLLEELNRSTPFQASVEPRELDCLVLVRQNRKKSPPPSQGGKPQNRLSAKTEVGLRNLPLSALVARLNSGDDLPLPVVDETNHAAPVDLDLTAPFSDLPALRRDLQRYGLDLKPARRKVPLLVVREKPVNMNGK